MEANDAGALAAGLEKLLLNPQEAVQMGRQGRQKVIEEFDAVQGVRTICKTFEEVITKYHEKQ